MSEKELRIGQKESQEVFIQLVPLGIGEEAKSQTAEWLSSIFDVRTVIHSGGSQASQNYVRPDGSGISLRHFGGGVFEDARTHLLHFSIFPILLYEEAQKLENLGIKNPLSKITIDDQCVAVTAFHGALSRLEERARGTNKHGTIGQGASTALKESREMPTLSIRAEEFFIGKNKLREKVETIRRYKLAKAQELIKLHATLLTIAGSLDDYEMLQDTELTGVITQSFLYLANLVRIVDRRYLDEILNEKGTIVSQPTHGALLHPRYGFVPHVGQVDPTGRDVLRSLEGHPHQKKIIRLGVSRCYMTRHGAGPLVSFNRDMTDQIQEKHNVYTDWLGEFRNGYYDLLATNYALEIAGGRESLQGLVINHLDILNHFNEWKVVEAYEFTGNKPEDLSDYFEFEGGRIVGIRFREDTKDQAQLDHQMRLTQLLKSCVPITVTLTPSRDKSLEEVFLDYVESKIGLPVVAVSHGPTVNDRQKRPVWSTIFK